MDKKALDKTPQRKEGRFLLEAPTSKKRKRFSEPFVKSHTSQLEPHMYISYFGTKSIQPILKANFSIHQRVSRAAKNTPPSRHTLASALMAGLSHLLQKGVDATDQWAKTKGFSFFYSMNNTFSFFLATLGSSLLVPYVPPQLWPCSLQPGAEALVHHQLQRCFLLSLCTSHSVPDTSTFVFISLSWSRELIIDISIMNFVATLKENVH